jgi:hypothetical protein
MSATVAELKKKYQQRRQQQSQSEPQTTQQTTQVVDRGIRGTLIDDYFFLLLARFGLPLLLIVLLGIGYLGLERILGREILTPIRIWGLAIAMYAYMCWVKLKLDTSGWIAVVSVSISTAGYLWQAIDAWVGKR